MTARNKKNSMRTRNVPPTKTRTFLILPSVELRTPRLAGRLKSTWARKGHTLALADTIVAAVAIDRGCALLTDNRKDFPMPEVRLYPLP